MGVIPFFDFWIWYESIILTFMLKKESKSSISFCIFFLFRRSNLYPIMVFLWGRIQFINYLSLWAALFLSFSFFKHVEQRLSSVLVLSGSNLVFGPCVTIMGLNRFEVAKYSFLAEYWITRQCYCPNKYLISSKMLVHIQPKISPKKCSVITKSILSIWY